MFGVVLWSDRESGKAVIWCEDHGDLAFYKETEPGTEILLGAGDLVEFDVTLDRQFRFANNPRVVSDSYSSGLADALAYSVDKPVLQPDVGECDNGSAQVILFDPQRSTREAPAAAQTGQG